ncbi:MAG TPA: hypothetical protein VJ799_08435 [Nitrososphaeraceae archaeon]|nr:hypothetical protein [Nitrososphaeraceae archaeon]
MPDGTIGHAEVRIGDSAIMMAEQKARIQTNASWDSLVCPLWSPRTSYMVTEVKDQFWRSMVGCDTQGTFVK